MDKTILEKKDRGYILLEQSLKVGIIGAMEEEVSQLIGQMEDMQSFVKAGMRFYEGRLENCPCVIVQSGIGKVNAGIAAQILIDIYQVSHIINTGIAGGLASHIHIGDMVIGNEFIYHDVDATGFGYALGEIPRMNRLVFEADLDLVKIALSLGHHFPEIQLLEGRILSGDQFIASYQIKEKIRDTFGGVAVEMEGAAIAHVAWLNQIPFLALRAISDNADDSASIDYPTFERQAIDRSVLFIREFLKRMAQ